MLFSSGTTTNISWGDRGYDPMFKSMRYDDSNLQDDGYFIVGYVFAVEGGGVGHLGFVAFPFQPMVDGDISTFGIAFDA